MRQPKGTQGILKSRALRGPEAQHTVDYCCQYFNGEDNTISNKATDFRRWRQKSLSCNPISHYYGLTKGSMVYESVIYSGTFTSLTSDLPEMLVKHSDIQPLSQTTESNFL